MTANSRIGTPAFLAKLKNAAADARLLKVDPYSEATNSLPLGSSPGLPETIEYYALAAFSTEQYLATNSLHPSKEHPVRGEN